jgi:hypothetical protein
VALSEGGVDVLKRSLWHVSLVVGVANHAGEIESVFVLAMQGQVGRLSPSPPSPIHMLSCRRLPTCWTTRAWGPASPLS